MIAIRKIINAMVAYTKNILDIVSPKMAKNIILSKKVNTENHRQSNVPGSVPSL